MSEDELRQNVALLENAKAQLEGFGRQRELILMTIDEHKRTVDTIRNISKGAPGDEILIPIGAEAFVYAKISESSDVIVGAGGDVSVQRTHAEAEKVINARISDLNKALGRVEEHATKTQTFVHELSEKVQAQYSAMQSDQQS
jgi:prefoldin alpha subunit